MAAIAHPNLFSNLMAPKCPILFDHTTEPVMTSCNEGTLRAKLIDRICHEILKANARGSRPSCFTERGILFNEAMQALAIPEDTQRRIGPSAPSSTRLLTQEGIFNADGLHIFDMNELASAMTASDAARCPNCRLQPSQMAISRSYYCYIKYNNPYVHLTNQRAAREFEKKVQVQDRINRSAHLSHAMSKLIAGREWALRRVLLPAAACTIFAHYALITIDMVFKSNLSLLSRLAFDFHSSISQKLSLLQWAIGFYTYMRSGAWSSSVWEMVYGQLIITHRGILPSILHS
jgi:hypothetical protein